MKVLICAVEAPIGPLNGLRLTLWHLCCELAREHEVTVVAFRWPDQRGDGPPGVVRIDLPARVPAAAGRWRERLLSMKTRVPVDTLRMVARMRAAVTALRATHAYDMVHVLGGALAGCADAFRGLPAIIAPLDAWPLNVAAAANVAHGPRRWWLAAQAQVVREYTAHAYRPFARVITVSDADAQSTAALDPSLAISVIPVGVDVEHFAVMPAAGRDRAMMLFTGTLSYPPNIAAAEFLAREVLPAVRREVPEARLVIAGRNPADRVAALAHSVGVAVVADPPDLRPWLARASVFACGMTQGTGIKIKLLEAMACGVPAVSTTLGCRGLAVADRRELLIADGAQAFGSAVVRIVCTPALANDLAHAARRYVVDHHSWSRIARRYESIYAECVRD